MIEQTQLAYNYREVLQLSRLIIKERLGRMDRDCWSLALRNIYASCLQTEKLKGDSRGNLT